MGYLNLDRLKLFWETIRDKYLLTYANANDVKNYQDTNDANITSIKSNIEQRAITKNKNIVIHSSDWHSLVNLGLTTSNSLYAEVDVEDLLLSDVPLLDVRPWFSSLGKTYLLSENLIDAFLMISYATCSDGSMTFHILNSTQAPQYDIPIVVKIIR